MQFWLQILVVFLIAVVIVLCGFNANTYNRIANENQTIGSVTPDGARALMWFNIIILVFLVPYFIYILYKLFVAEEKKEKFEKYLEQKYIAAKQYRPEYMKREMARNPNSPMASPFGMNQRNMNQRNMNQTNMNQTNNGYTEDLLSLYS